MTAQLQMGPNIVIIVSDDHAFQDIGAYGSKLVETPSIFPDKMEAIKRMAE